MARKKKARPTQNVAESLPPIAAGRGPGVANRAQITVPSSRQRHVYPLQQRHTFCTTRRPRGPHLQRPLLLQMMQQHGSLA